MELPGRRLRPAATRFLAYSTSRLPTMIFLTPIPARSLARASGQRGPGRRWIKCCKAATRGSSGDGLLLYSGLSPTDVILAADSSQADDLSLLARVNGTTYYRLRIQDSSTPNAAVM